MGVQAPPIKYETTPLLTLSLHPKQSLSALLGSADAVPGAGAVRCLVECRCTTEPMRCRCGAAAVCGAACQTDWSTCGERRGAAAASVNRSQAGGRHPTEPRTNRTTVPRTPPPTPALRESRPPAAPLTKSQYRLRSGAFSISLGSICCIAEAHLLSFTKLSQGLHRSIARCQ